MAGVQEIDAQGSERRYDVIVIGAGSTGENVADYAHQGGLSVALIESELVGGDCSYWACMPSKALLRSGQALDAARAVDGARQAVTGNIDVAAVLARRDGFTSHYDDSGQVQWAVGAGLDVFCGKGRLSGERRVVVEADGGRVTLLAEHAVVVCTGSVPALAPIEGLSEAAAWTNKEATSAKAVPRRLAIIGGGVVGCEMASAWRSLGTEAVTIVEFNDRLLPGVEPEAGRRVAAAFAEQGIDARLGVRVARVERAPGGEVTLHLADGTTVLADELLVATGRAPRTTDIGMETVGLVSGAWLDVDDSCEVTAVAGQWLYGAGDVNHRALLTHMGKYQARICGEVIAARAKGDPAAAHPAPWSRYAATADHDVVPQVIFTQPQVAAVGMTEDAARVAGLNVRCATYELGHVAGAALFADGYSGWAKLVVDRATGIPVGATFVGPEVSELVHAATIAIVGGVCVERLWHAVPAYPTVSEIWLRLLEAYRKEDAPRA